MLHRPGVLLKHRDPNLKGGMGPYSDACIGAYTSSHTAAYSWTYTWNSTQRANGIGIGGRIASLAADMRMFVMMQMNPPMNQCVALYPLWRGVDPMRSFFGGLDPPLNQRVASCPV